jgi:transketolase
MGSAIAELLAQHFPVPQELIGVRDLFGQSGAPAELIEHYGMDTKSIVEAVLKVTKR